MKRPNPKNYGQDTPLWKRGGEKAYKLAVQQWKEYREKYGIKPGRKRTREIHESWQPYLALFDSSTTTRSQGAFCRASGVNRATLSGAMCKPITVAMEEKISIWIEKLEKKQNEI